MHVTRRNLLLRFGPAALLVYPALRSFRAESDEGDPPRRFVTFFSSSGVYHPSFWPTGSTGTWESGNYDVAGTSLEGLAPYMSKVLIPRGIDVDEGPGDDHDAGTIAALTGNYLASQNGSAPFALGESLDRFLARQIGQDTPVPYLLQGVRLQIERASRYVSFDQNGQATPYQQDPYQLYDSVFSSLVGDCQGGGLSPVLQQALSRRMSVLDVVGEETAAMKAACGLSQEEKIKLEQMEESVRSIERRLEASGEPVQSQICEEVKEAMEGPNQVANQDANFPELLRLHLDLQALALELDITRVATISLSLGGSGGATMDWLNWTDDNGTTRTVDESHHTITHGDQAGVSDRVPKLRVIDRWNFDQFAYLLGRLDAISEGDGTLLDNSLVWYNTDVSDGYVHDHGDMPYIVAGGAAGGIETGRYVQFDGSPLHQRLMLSFIHAMGLSEVEEFGRAGTTDAGPLL